ncbi:MAG: c-type cytochrome [Luteitalea sp.]|nr:c-type cytochrome [Luteitalea sp.]
MTLFRPAISLAIIALPLLLAGRTLPAAAPEPSSSTVRWADWIEPDFPFFSSVLDARRSGPGFPTNNLTPRGLVLNLGHGYWVGFDVDLLRVAAIWRGNAVTPRALAPGSYHASDKKTKGGQFPAPEPDGRVWLANGIYPGWQSGRRPSFDDPRELAPSPEEVGRGPLSEEMGRFKAIRQVRDGVVLEYTASGAEVREWVTLSEHNTLERRFHVGPTSETLWLLLGIKAEDATISLGSEADVSPVLETIPFANDSGTAHASATGSAEMWAVRVPPHDEPLQFGAALTESGSAQTPAPRAIPTDMPTPRWPQEITSKITRSTAKDAYVVDDIALPLDNPWRRNVRLGDIQFLRDGTGVGVTLDGDVWFIHGLHERDGVARWRRFASGLHEPLTLAIRDDQVYVFDRNGIWRLRDTNGDGEADVHELFSNAFAQTADMREFPNTLRLAPGGEFVIAKGNQQATTIGKHNGHVLRISADGRRATVLGYGFRQPNIGVNVRTGVVTASDQQGHYIPTTPLHIVRGRQFYGFLSDKQPREVYPAPIAEPLTWIPHAANASAMSQVWLFGARMGPLNEALVHIGFNNPELFRVYVHDNDNAKPEAAVVSLTRAFDFPPLNGSVNPADGQLYLAGFQILGWGTTATRLAGLGRVRYTGAPSTVPRDVVPTDEGVLLRFDAPLDADTAVAPDSYSVMSWHYVRTHNYGSPQLKADGTPGMDRLVPSAAYLSKDGRNVFVAVPEMKPVMQMRIAWSLETAEGVKFQENAYFTPYELRGFDPRAEGFGDLTVDLSPRTTSADTAAPVSAEEGRRLYQSSGCIACHSTDTSISKLGPTFKGLYGGERRFANGAVRVVADEVYLREAILEPSAKVVAGYESGEAGMPSYAGVLTEAQIDSIILYIKSLE